MHWLKTIRPSVKTVGRGSWPLGHVEPTRSLYDHELVFFESGTCRLESERGDFDVAAGSWVVIPPAVSHRSEGLTDGVLRHWVHFDWTAVDASSHPTCAFAPDEIDANLARHPPANAPPSLSPRPWERSCESRGLLERLHRNWESRRLADRLSCDAIFLEILTHLFTPRDSLLAPMAGHDVALANRLKTAIERAAVSGASVRWISRRLGYSHEHLGRLFKREFGMTPASYLNAVRVEKARGLLTNTLLAVDDVGERCGFHSTSYFIAVFKRLTGTTPGRHRR